MGSKRRALSFLLAAMLLLANTAVVAFPAVEDPPTPVSLAGQTLVFTVDSAAYTGLAQTPSFTVHLGSSEGTLLQLDTDYTVTYSDNVNAGDTAVLVITGTGAYQDSASHLFTISKAPLTVSTVTVAPKSYDGDSAATVSGATFGGLLNGDTLAIHTDYTVAAAFADANVGSGKTVTGAVTLLNTPAANNYLLSDGAFNSTGSIDKADYAGTLSGSAQVSVVAGANTYTLSNLALPAGFTGVTYSYVSMAAGTLLNSAVTPTISNGVLSFTTVAADSGATGSVTVKVSSENYNDVEAVITVAASGKHPCTVSNVRMSGVTYGSTLGTPTASVSGASGAGNWTYTYSGSANDGTVFTDSVDKPTKAGSYTVTATYETATHRGSGSAAFTIDKRQLGWNTSALRVAAKTFDNSTAASFTGTPALSGAAAGDTPALDSYQLTGTFNSVNVASNKTVTAWLSGAVLASDTANNYLPPAAKTLSLKGAITALSQPFCTGDGTLTAQTLAGAAVPDAGVYADLSEEAKLTKAKANFLTAVKKSSGFSAVGSSRIVYTDLSYSEASPFTAITFWLPYPSETLAENWDDYKFTLKHMNASGVISNVTVTPTVNGLKVSGITSLSPFALGWVKRSTSSSSGYSSSGGGSQSDFWNTVYKEVNSAKAGTTVKVAAKSYTTMPSSVMRALDEADRVAMSITWNGGDDILIPADKAQKDYASRSNYTLSYLVGKYIGNPDTGGREDPPVAVTVLAPDENAAMMSLAQERVPLTQTDTFRWAALILAAAAGALVLLGGALACRIDWKKKR